MINKNLFKIFLLLFAFAISVEVKAAGGSDHLLKTDWSFKGIFGKFDRASLQRGYQVYKEVCASCHSMKYMSFRNLGEEGGPEFTEEEVKALAASYEITDGPNADGEMFTRPGRPSDKFKSPYPNVNAAMASNGGAYPPDLSVIAKARAGGADYIYSLMMGYKEKPADFVIEDGVYYNEYMEGNKIKMPAPLSDGRVEYTDGTEASLEQLSKDVTTFLMWTAEPHLEARHRTGTKVLIYLILLATLVYFSMKKIWLGVNSEK